MNKMEALKAAQAEFSRTGTIDDHIRLREAAGRALGELAFQPRHPRLDLGLVVRREPEDGRRPSVRRAAEVEGALVEFEGLLGAADDAEHARHLRVGRREEGRLSGGANCLTRLVQ